MKVTMFNLAMKTSISDNQANNEARATYAQSSKERRYWLDPKDVADSVLFAVSAPNPAL